MRRQQLGLPLHCTNTAAVMRCFEIHPAPTHLHPPPAPPRLQELLGCLKQLLAVDRSWLPAQEGFSIYIRPFLYSSGETGQCSTTSLVVPPLRDPTFPSCGPPGC